MNMTTKVTKTKNSADLIGYYVAGVAAPDLAVAEGALIEVTAVSPARGGGVDIHSLVNERQRLPAPNWLMRCAAVKIPKSVYDRLKAQSAAEKAAKEAQRLRTSAKRERRARRVRQRTRRSERRRREPASSLRSMRSTPRSSERAGYALLPILRVGW